MRQWRTQERMGKRRGLCLLTLRGRFHFSGKADRDKSQKTAWDSVSVYKGKYYGAVDWSLFSLPWDVHIQTGSFSGASHPASHSAQCAESASSHIWVPVWDLKFGGWPINLVQESLFFQLRLEGKLSLYPGNFGRSSSASWEGTDTNLLLQKQELLRWFLTFPCLCNHIFPLTKRGTTMQGQSYRRVIFSLVQP